MALPIKTTEEDINVLANYLDNKVGMVPLAQLRTAVSGRHADNRKLEAIRFIGFMERNGEEVKLTDEGHAYARATGEKRQAVVAARLKAIPLYAQTLDYMHFQSVLEPSKTQIAQYWADKQAGKLEGAAGAALTDAAVFFLRLVGMSGIGKFIAAGLGRDTHVEADPSHLAAFVTGAGPAVASAPKQHQPPETTTAMPSYVPAATIGGAATVSSGVNINIEVHVAGDAKADTVREIFRNMRKYVLGLPDIDEKKS